jgi:hypothetical protein
MTLPFFNYNKKQKQVVTHKHHPRSRTDVISEIFKTDDGRDFLFEGREYLKPIYNGSHRYLVLIASRQAEKSSFLSKDLLLDALTNDHDSLLYVSALQSMVNEFISRKINKQFQMNPELLKASFGRNSRNNNLEKVLTNGTTITFRTIGTSPDAARGIAARKIYFDEVQSINPESVPVVSECAQAYPDSSAYFFTGTPLSSGNILSRKYAETCQNEWIITCKHCKTKNPPLGIAHIDVLKPYLFCIHCGKDMSGSPGQWVAQRPNAKKIGFRICRLMTPSCVYRNAAHAGVLDKYEIYPESQFHNEVLGLPFDQGSMPISEAEIFANCGDHDFIDVNQPPEHIKQKVTYGAIDWAWSNRDGGQSYTILAIGHLNLNKIEILYVKRFFGPQYHSPEKVLSEIAQTMNRVHVDVIISDFGVGHKENIRLRSMVKAEVFEMQYVTSDKESVWDSSSKCYKIGRTVTLDLVINRLKKQLYNFPKQSVIKPYAEDIMNVYTEYDPNYKKIRYIHNNSGADDFFHLLNFLAIVSELHNNIKIR